MPSVEHVTDCEQRTIGRFVVAPLRFGARWQLPEAGRARRHRSPESRRVSFCGAFRGLWR